MKSKNKKIQTKIFKKVVASWLAMLFVIAPVASIVPQIASIFEPVVYANTSTASATTVSAETVAICKAVDNVSKLDEYLKAQNKFYITNENQLRILAEYVNSGNDCYGKEFILLNNIDLGCSKEGGSDWVPIGNELNKPFNGTFNGNNQTISDLKIRITGDEDATQYLGLFGTAYNNATIKNLTLQNVIMTVNVWEDVSSMGAIVGYNFGTIKNCSVIAGDVNDRVYSTQGANLGGIGGIAGGNEGIVTYCRNDIAVSTSEGDCTGGIVGHNGGEISYCINNGEISSYEMVGGIAGYSFGTIKHCSNRGNISGADREIGGIVGKVDDGEIYNCSNSGEIGVVSGSTSASGYSLGGIVGKVENLQILERCLNQGKVVGTGTTGGIVGSLDDNVEIKDCLNKGEIISSEQWFSGGIVGISWGKANIYQCSNLGNVIGGGAVGGILGEIGRERCDIYNCYNSGTITAVSDEHICGAIVGLIDNYKKNYITNCVNSGKPDNLYYNFSGSEVIVKVDTLYAPGISYPESELDVSINFDSVKEPTIIIGSNQTIPVTNTNATELGTDEKYPDEEPLPPQDTTPPTIKETRVYVTEALEGGRYTVDKEIILKVITSEKIDRNNSKYENPEIQVSFSESGIGKWNYITDTNRGYAKCIDISDINGYTVYTYAYKIEKGDNGKLRFQYGNYGKLVDLAGNEGEIATEIQVVNNIYADTAAPTISVSKSIVLEDQYDFNNDGKSNLSDSSLLMKYIAKWDLDETIINNIEQKADTNFDGKINLSDVSKIQKALANWQSSGSTKSDRIKYTISFNETVNNFTKDDITVINGKIIEFTGSNSTYTVTVGTDIEKGNTGDLQLIVEQDVCTDIVGYGNTRFEDRTTIDKKSPTVEINQNKEEIKIGGEHVQAYVFDFIWDEGVTGFNTSDLYISNGDIYSFTGSGNYYTLKIIPEISDDIVVSVKENSCVDYAGNSNIKSNQYIIGVLPVPTITRVANLGDLYDFSGDNFTNMEDMELLMKYISKKDLNEDIKGRIEEKGDINSDGKINLSDVTMLAKKLLLFSNGESDLDLVDLGESYDFDGDKDTDKDDVDRLLEYITGGDLDEQIINNIVKYGNSDYRKGDINNDGKINTQDFTSLLLKLQAPADTINTNRSNYMVEFNEDVEGFTIDDITVNNGTVSYFKQYTESEYYITVDTSVKEGDVGELQIIVEGNVCKDLLENGNARVEKIITVDKKAPLFYGLESYTSSEISVDSQVDIIKKYYKVGDTVTIIAKFDENIEKTNAPVLALQFSESGKAKGSISSIEKIGNKIEYVYTIEEGDKGELSVRGFSGIVIDNVGNETVVGKKDLEGNTIIADSEKPELTNITAIAPNFEYDELLLDNETKRYGEISKSRDTNLITVIVEYSENVYYLNSTTIEQINNLIAPALELQFSESGKAVGDVQFDKVEGNKLYYTYSIKSGDNGELSIASLNGQIANIAGSTCETTSNSTLPTIIKYEDSILEENVVEKIVADTTSTNITFNTSAINYDDNINEITGNSIDNKGYYRKGTVITITATTDEYVYANNLERITIETAPTLNIGFSQSGTGVGTCTNVEYIENKTMFTYTYEVKDGDNGELSLSFAETQSYDICLNGNNTKEETISSIITDTESPQTNWQAWVESKSYGIVDNKNGTWDVTFSEKVYVFDENTLKIVGELNNSNKESAPLLLVSKDNVTPLETTISNITVNSEGKTVITYSYADYTKNMGPYGMRFATVSDIAGNIFNYRDIYAPKLTEIKVTNPEIGTYKEGDAITIVATFSEKLNEQSVVPTLSLQFSESGDAKGNASAGIIKENTITYTYTITAQDNKGNGDNGVLSIKSYTGTGLLDLSDNEWVAPENVTLAGNQIKADTISPVITKVEAKVNDNVIGKFVNETQEHVAGRTNEDTITYVITFSEPVSIIDKDRLEIMNGIITEISNNNAELTITVKTTTEGVQSLIIPEGIVQDTVGHTNEFLRFNEITVDFTKATVRFISEYNGGVYVLPTNIGKIELRSNIEISEDILKVEYKWDNGEYQEIQNYSTASDISVPSKTFTQAGDYQLFVRVTDIAGNITETSNMYKVLNSKIEINTNVTEITNRDIVATIKFGEGLTENIKVTFKENGTNEIVNLNANEVDEQGNIEYTISTNGIIYAEATDRVGNKVYNEYRVTNIDKDAPIITFNYTSLTVELEEKLEAIIKTDEDAIISYSWDNTNWVDSAQYVNTQNVEKEASTIGKQVLYAKATDKLGNQSEVETIEFNIIEGERAEAEIIFEDIPTIQVNNVKYVKISSQMVAQDITDRMNKEALKGKIPQYIKLTQDGDLRTGSEITIDNETRYVIVVNGDINGDGKVTPIDVTSANSIRLNKTNETIIQRIAADFDMNSKVQPIDITMINSYRLGKIKDL